MFFAPPQVKSFPAMPSPVAGYSLQPFNDVATLRETSATTESATPYPTILTSPHEEEALQEEVSKHLDSSELKGDLDLTVTTSDRTTHSHTAEQSSLLLGRKRMKRTFSCPEVARDSVILEVVGFGSFKVPNFFFHRCCCTGIQHGAGVLY